MLSIDKLLLQIGRNMHKNALFLLKIAKKKSPRAGDFAPRPPLAFCGWGLRSKTSNPPLRTPGLHTIYLMLNIKHENCIPTF